MALNPKFLDLEKTAIQCRGKQSELDVFQKCYSYEDYANLFWAQIFLLEYWRQATMTFKHFCC